MSTLSLTSAFVLLLKRDLTLAYRRRAELVNPLLFFVLVTAMFPLGIGNDPVLIEKVGPIPGFFLGEAHTREWWSKEQFVPKASDQLTHLEWEVQGKKSALDYAKEITAQILADYEHDLPEDQEAELDRILDEAREYYREKDLL